MKEQESSLPEIIDMANSPYIKDLDSEILAILDEKNGSNNKQPSPGELTTKNSDLSTNNGIDSPTSVNSDGSSEGSIRFKLRNRRWSLAVLGIIGIIATITVDWDTMILPMVSHKKNKVNSNIHSVGERGQKKKQFFVADREDTMFGSGSINDVGEDVTIMRESSMNGGGGVEIVDINNDQSNVENNDNHGRRMNHSDNVSNLEEIPVIDANEEVPGTHYTSTITFASDALHCRKSVINFVINATDIKDECDGLRKAFDKTCNSDSAEEIVEGKHHEVQVDITQDNNGATVETSATNRRRTRRLFESSNDDSLGSKWKLYTYRTCRTISHLFKKMLYGSNREVFFSEDAVMAGWDKAKYEVVNNYDETIYDETIGKIESKLPLWLRESRRKFRHYKRLHKQEIQRQRRYLEEERGEVVVQSSVATEGTEQQIDVTTEDKQETLYAPVEDKNKTDVKKPLPSLKMPTNTAHVSNQMLGETLVITQEKDVIAKVIEKATNKTVEGNKTFTDAAVDAVVSSKAVSDTEAAVAAVLNDPASVEARTCCASILNVFHENCDIPEGEEVSDKRLVIIILVIAFCGMVKSLIRHFEIRWLPEAAGCILVGVAGGAILSFFPHYDIAFDGNWFLRIMVPPIVFEAALSIDKNSFKKHMVPIVIYAVVGTLFASAITALIINKGTYYLPGETIPVVESLLFGSLISSIDPIAVLSVLSNMGMSNTDTIYVLIFGESLLNDGVAIVFFQTLVHFLDESLIIDSHAIVAATMHFLVVALGSLFVGLASGMVCTVYYWAMHGCHTPLVEVLMFFCWAFIPYYICDGVEWSGIVSVVATGFVMDIYVVGLKHNHHNDTNLGEAPSLHPRKGIRLPGRRIFSKEGHLSSTARTHVHFVTEILATMMETAIFAYLGLFLFSYRYHWNVWHAACAIVACCLSRAMMIPSMSFFANWITSVQNIRITNNCRPSRDANGRPISSKQSDTRETGVIVDSRMQLVLWVAGLRGAMSFALVEHIPLFDTVTGEGSRFKGELKAMTSTAIVFTVFFLGGYTYYMMDRLGLVTKAHNEENEEKTSLMHHNGNRFSLSKLKTDDEENVKKDSVRQRSTKGSIGSCAASVSSV